jgi:hypothetical protein
MTQINLFHQIGETFTHWVKHNICTYQRVFLLLTASYGVSTQNPESRQGGKPLNPGNNVYILNPKNLRSSASKMGFPILLNYRTRDSGW